MSPETLNEELRRTKLRTLKLEPREENERMLMAEPNRPKVRVEKPDPKLHMFNTDNLCPNLTTDRTLMDEPAWMKLKMLNALPARTVDLSESELLMQPKLAIEMESPLSAWAPKWQRPTTEQPLPSVANHLTEMLEPVVKKLNNDKPPDIFAKCLTDRLDAKAT